MSEYNEQHRIIGKIIISAKLANESPLLIGKGMGNEADIEILRLPGGKPYIPASSFAGALYSFYKGQVDKPEQQKVAAEAFWGSCNSKNETTYQSHIIFDDLVAISGEQKVTIRDGIKIAYTTNLTNEGDKYDYQLLEPGTCFAFNAEVTLRQNMDIETVLSIVKFIESTLQNDNFRLGAFTGFGFGKLKCSDFKTVQFNFQFKEDAEHWFSYLSKADKADATTLKGFDYEAAKLEGNKKKTFCIKACFELKSAIIIGAYQTDANKPDKTHLTSDGKPVLTGKSIKGALRHRANKILNTLKDTFNITADELLNDMMGWVGETPGGKARKSRLRVEETILKGVTAMKQNRIKIDRFTGGTIPGALFDTEPVWKNNKEYFSLSFILKVPGEIDAEEEEEKQLLYIEKYRREKALLLHLLKDLWTADLAIGGEKNIGRGILKGKQATITDDGKTIAEFTAGENDTLVFSKDFVVSSGKELNKIYFL